jgi:NAD(P)-dependent dehydrogenase (short-subunit alcohol dehydrogenase family)
MFSGGMMDRLSDKIALITGSARGIGVAIVELFYEEGATVIVIERTVDGGILAGSAATYPSNLLILPYLIVWFLY